MLNLIIILLQMQFKESFTTRSNKKQPFEPNLQIKWSKIAPNTVQQVTIPEERKQIVYDNRIFHIKKKYTLPVERLQLQTKRRNVEINQLPKYKQSSYFSKYLDSVHKNHQILRRGACEAALPNSLIKNFTHRGTRITTQGSYQLIRSQQQKLGYFQTVSNNDGAKREKKDLGRDDDLLKSKHKNLPTLAGTNINRMEQILPIRVQQFVSKGMRKAKNVSPEDANKIKKNIMHRKLDIQLINYNLLGKWVNSGLIA